MAGEFEYLEDLATADVAFRASGETVAEVIIACADAMLQATVAEVETVRSQVRRNIEVVDDSLEMAFFQLLQELIYLKDTQSLLLRLLSVRVDSDCPGQTRLCAQATGERLDPARHDVQADLKAVTLHQFELRQTNTGWTATVVIDM